MSDERQTTQQEHQALDELGQNFDALLARTPEPAQRADRRRFVLAGAAMAAGVLALIVWASWPGDRIVESAVGGIAEIAAQQKAPDPLQYVESESVVATLTKEDNTFSTSNVARRAWLSMARSGVIESRLYVEGPDGAQRETNVSRTRPMPNYRIAGAVYRPSQIAAFAKRPDELIANIDAKAAEVAPRFRPEMKWKYLTDPLKAIAPPLPSALRAALIGELESLPGVQGPVSVDDPNGRDGLKLSLDTDAFTLGVIFDPEDAQLLYSDTRVRVPSEGPFPDAKPGRILISYVLISSRVVDSAPRVSASSR